MTDQNSQFFAILTAVGEAKQANANALGVPWTFAQMGVGDANNTDPVPSRTQTKLINERRRAPLNQLSVDPKDASIIIAEQVIPPDVGGWWIREIGLYDAAGDLVAVANCAPSYKPLLAQGTGKTQVVRLNLVVTSTANVQLKIDPAVVLATREYVDSSIISVLPKNKVAGSYTKVRINDRGVVQEGSNPTTLAGYGIVDALKVGVTSYQRPILSGLGYGSAAESGGAIEIREAQEVGASNKSFAYAPRIMMHWTGVISGDIAMDSLGQLQWKSQRIYHEGNFNPAIKADKATTLGGYGITDAMPKNAGGLLTQPEVISGRITDVPGTRFISTGPATTDRPDGVTYAAGMHITWGSGEQGIDFLGSLNGAEEFFVRSYYQGVGTHRRLWTEKNFNPEAKADKATTLSGYGITDAISTKGGTLDGNLTFLSARNLYMRAGQTQSFASGLVALSDTDVTQAGVGFWGNQTAGYTKAYLALGPTPWANGRGIRVDTNGIEVSGPANFDGVITGNGSGIHSLVMATQAEAEAGTDMGRPMSALRVFQAISKVVKQATESVVGVLRVATLSEVVAGVRDDAVVTPLKLRWGFSASFGINSYIAFPSWLGGLVIQAGTGPMITDNTAISFPIAFPTKCLALLEHDRTGTGGANMTFWQFRDVTNAGFNALNMGMYSRNASAWAGVSVSSGCTWFAIGY